jgi:hypothetical protein
MSVFDLLGLGGQAYPQQMMGGLTGPAYGMSQYGMQQYGISGMRADPVRQAVDQEVANRTAWLSMRLQESEAENQRLRKIIHDTLTIVAGGAV